MRAFGTRFAAALKRRSISARSNHTMVAFTAETLLAEYPVWREIMSSENFLGQLNTLATDGRFSVVSALDLRNILTAIELCELGFGSGAKVTEGLNQLLRDEWPSSFETSPNEC
jgi:hypothetical protein